MTRSTPCSLRGALGLASDHCAYCRYAGRSFEKADEPGQLMVKGLKSMWRQAAPIVRSTLTGALSRILLKVPALRPPVCSCSKCSGHPGNLDPTAACCGAQYQKQLFSSSCHASQFDVHVTMFGPPQASNTSKQGMSHLQQDRKHVHIYWSPTSNPVDIHVPRIQEACQLLGWSYQLDKDGHHIGRGKNCTALDIVEPKLILPELSTPRRIKQ